MPRKSSSKLHELIQSLTKSEKRYYKLHASFVMKNSEENQYLRLFDILERAKVYDEVKVMKELKDVKEYFVIKNVLYSSILKSLAGLYAEKSSRMFTRSKLNEIDILFRKGLYKQGHKLIDQTKKKAEQNEQFETLLQLINMEQKLLVSAMAFKSLKSYKERIKVLMDETKNVLNTIENIKEYDTLLLPIARLHFEGAQFQQKKDLHYLEELMKNDLLSSEQKTLSLRARLNFYYIWGMYHKLLFQKDKALPFFEKRLKLFENVDVFMQEMFSDYLFTLQFTAELAEETNKRELCEKLLTQLQKLYLAHEEFAPEHQSNLFVYYFLAKFENLKFHNRFEEIIPFEEEIFEGIEKYKAQINIGLQQELFYYIAYAYFAVGKFKQAEKVLQSILNNKSTGVKSDIFNISNILYLLCLYENGNHEAVKNTAKVWMKSLDKENVYFEIDSEIIQLLLRLIRSEKKQARSHFYDFRDFLMSRQFDMQQLKLYKYFDASSWLEGKIHGKTIFEQNQP